MSRVVKTIKGEPQTGRYDIPKTAHFTRYFSHPTPKTSASIIPTN